MTAELSPVTVACPLYRCDIKDNDGRAESSRAICEKKTIFAPLKSPYLCVSVNVRMTSAVFVAKITRLKTGVGFPPSLTPRGDILSAGLRESCYS
jgi:hypothetical protein